MTPTDLPSAARVAERHLERVARADRRVTDLLREMRSLTNWEGTELLRRFKVPTTRSPTTYGIVGDREAGGFWATEISERALGLRGFVDPGGRVTRSRHAAHLHKTEEEALAAILLRVEDVIRQRGLEPEEEEASGFRWWPFGGREMESRVAEAHLRRTAARTTPT